MDVARYLVDALERARVKHVVICPGSRSAPLVYALAEAEADGRIQVHVRIDERVAGFTALGLARAHTGADGKSLGAAVVTTSGTAVGNLLPAVMEANHMGVPLLVISADRPEELRGTGANQTTEQFDLFGEHVRFATDVAAGTDPSSAVATALSAARGRLDAVPSGPAQLNVAFRDPLTPALDGSEWEHLASLPAADEDEVAADFTDIALPSNQHRTVVVAGDSAGAEAEFFARTLGLPLLAEPSSNARFGPNAIGPYRLLLEHFTGNGRQSIERVVVFGRPTLSRPIAKLLANTAFERALYVPHPVSWFEDGRRAELVLSQWDQLVGFAGTGPKNWLSAWQEAAAAASTALEAELEAFQPETLNGLEVAAQLWEASGSEENLVLGSSNPIRDVDLAATPGHGTPQVFANRGLAGIDGTIATATGIALATRRVTRVLLGDLTFLHDVGALLMGANEEQPDLQLVVLNDGGGGIFSTLEHGELAHAPDYAAAVERFFGTPHTVKLAELAKAYGWQHTAVANKQELALALAQPVSGRGIIEVSANRASLRQLHAGVAAKTRAAVS